MVVKIALCGEEDVGKEELRHKYLGFNFKSQYMMTIGAEFSIKDVIWTHGPLAGSSTKVQIWDLAPQKRFHPVRPLYFSGCHGAILVYDASRYDTLLHLIEWLIEIKKYAGTIPVAVIGNKIELRRFSKDPVSTKIGINFVKLIKQKYLHNIFDIPFVEISNRSGKIVEKVFKSLCEVIYTSYMQ